jgi:two-component system, cell cycle sensor histidine kinase and response regulator CckA
MNRKHDKQKQNAKPLRQASNPPISELRDPRSQSLRVLIVEDEPDDAELMIQELRRGGYEASARRVDTPEAMHAGLDEEDWDVIIADYSMPGFTGLDALKIMQEKGLDIPFILISGTIGEDMAVQAIKAGAHDYLMKDRLARLTSAIEREINQSQVRRERKRSEDTLRAVFESVMDGILVADVENQRFLVTNQGLCRMLGYSREEILNLGVKDIHPAEDLPHVQEQFQRQAEGGIGIAADMPVKRKNGSVFYADVNARLVELDGRACVVGVFRDITDRRKAEARERHLTAVLRAIRGVNQLITREKDRNRLIQEACAVLTSTRGFKSVWIALVDETGAFVQMAESSVSPGCLPLTEMLTRGEWPVCARNAFAESGVAVMEYGASACRDCPLGSYHEDDGAFAARLEKGEKVYGMIIVSLPKDMMGDREEQGLFTEVVGDIGFALHSLEQEERKMAAEAALRESEARFKILFEYAPDAYYLHDLEGRFIDGNRAAETMTGYSKEDLIGKSFLDLHLLPPDELGKAAGFLHESAQGLSTGPEELILNQKDGKQIPVEIRTFPFELENQVVVLGIARDITLRKDMEQQLQQSQKMESVGRLAGGVAHDFNNLLTTILGNASMVLMDTGKDDPCRAMIEEIKRAGERAANLTRQLLAFSRKQIIQPEVICLNEVINDIEKMLRRIIGEDIELKIDPAPDLGNVEADVGQIEQVIMNLIVNARDAMPHGGKLTIETANVELDETYARAHMAVTPGPYVMLAVSDTGTGMSREIMSQVFDPFFTTKEKGKGTGLGLSTVYGIVKQSNGNIWVYSEPEKGATFKIYLPRCEETAITRNTEDGKEKMLQGTETVLVVEDDEPVRELAINALRRYGYHVLCAPDGQEALRVLQEHEGMIHLMLTDVVMPGMSGGDLGARAQEVRGDLKVLYMSGYTDNAIVHHGVLDKGTPFLQKPFTPDRVASKVREVLEG